MMGQLAGDSLGSLVEFQTPERIAIMYPEGLTRLRSGGVWGTLAGQPTDDSEMALALARSIVRSGGYDAEQAARGYIGWYRSRPFDIGSTTSGVLSRGEARVADRTPGSRSVPPICEHRQPSQWRTDARQSSGHRA